MKRLSNLVVGGVLCLLVAAVPTFAVEPLYKPFDRVPAGFDYWQTLGSGATAYSFANDPLPKGFFCDGSKAFAGLLKFEGVPLRTVPHGILGATDTIIERLDDAVFDDKGVGMTRIQIRELQLVSSTPIATPCGTWRAVANLASGEQPITPMRLTRRNEFGGDYQADLWIKVDLTFVRESDGESRVVTRTLHLPTAKTTAYACWTRYTTATPSTSPTSPASGTTVNLNSPSLSSSTTTSVYVQQPGTTTRVRIYDFDSNGCVVGYQCQDGTCLPVYSWHEAFDDEDHFVSTPCDLGYEQFCDEDDEEAYRAQLKDLRRLGIIDAAPEVVLERQRNPRGQRLLPQIKN